MTDVTPNTRSRIGTVILNWNKPALTAECARLVAGQDVVGGQKVSIIDNGSTPANREQLRVSLPPSCVFRQANRNLGFAGGMNVGIRSALDAGCEYIWLLNNDAFPEPGCLSALVDALVADRRLAAVTPALFDRAGREQHAVGCVVWDPVSTEVEAASSRPGTLGTGYWLTGTALLVRAEAVRTIGGFDPRFFAYWEEVDWCLRATAAGYLLRAVPEARCRHLEAASSNGIRSPFVQHLMTRNGVALVRKHLRWRSAVPAGMRSVAEGLSRAASLDRHGNPAGADAVVGGLWAAVSGRRGRPGRLAAPNWVRWLARAQGWRVSRALRAIADRLATPLPRMTNP